MDITQFLGLKGSAPSRIEEAAYELIAFEISSNQVRQGLWTKALADVDWNDAKAKPRYVKMRHEQLIAEINKTRTLSKHQASKLSDPVEEAAQYGLTDEDVAYLGRPIKAIRYLEKYAKTKAQVLEAIANRKLTSVMKNEILWVSDRPL